MATDEEAIPGGGADVGRVDGTASRGYETTHHGREAAGHGTGGREETVSAPVTAVATILATVVGVGVLAVGVGLLAPGVVAVVGGCLLTGTVTAAKRRTPGGRALGSVLTVAAAVAITAAVGLAMAAGPPSVDAAHRAGVVLSIALAAFGATATLTGAIGDGAVRSAVPIAVTTALPLWLVAAVATWVARGSWLAWRDRLPGFDAGRAVDPLLAPDGAVVAVVGFVAALVALLWTVSLVLPRLPIVQLLPRDRRREARERIARTTDATTRYGFVVLVLGLVVATLLALEGEIGVPAVEDAAALLESILVPVAASPAIRAGLLAGIAALVALYALSRLPGVYRLRHSSTVAWLPILAGGVLAAAVVVVGYPVVFDRLLDPELAAVEAEGSLVPVPGGPGLGARELRMALAPPDGIAVAAVAATGAIVLVVALALAVWLLGALALLPDRAAPGSLAAGALVAGSVFAAVTGAGTLVVALPVACAIVAWDGALYGVSITEELGRDAPARRPALVHVTGTALVGAVSVALALGLTALAASFTVRTGVTIVASLTVALLAVWIALKRRAVRALRIGESGARESTEADRDAPRRRGEPAAGGRGTPDGSADPGDGTDGPDDATPESAGHAPDWTDDPVDETTLQELTAAEARAIREAGFETLGDLAGASRREISGVRGIQPAKASVIAWAVEDLVDSHGSGNASKESRNASKESRNDSHGAEHDSE